MSLYTQMPARLANILVTVDAVVFGYARSEGVSVLLIQRKYPPFKNSWALPGGFVLEEESLEEAVRRELKEETGIGVNYLEQVYTFGTPGRDPRQRVLSVAYFALVNTTRFQELRASTDAENAKWFRIKELPELAFDHREILGLALDRLRTKIRYQPIGFELLDPKFPFADLEHLYSSLLDRPIDRRNFYRKIMSLRILEETREHTRQEGKGRPGRVYCFNEKRYQELEKEGTHFEV